MPCYDARGDRNSPFYEGRTDSQFQAEIDQLTRLLCETLTAAERGQQIPDEVAIWWREHQRFDAQRRRARFGKGSDARCPFEEGGRDAGYCCLERGHEGMHHLMPRAKKP